MGTTPLYGLPSPENPDIADGPQQIGALAQSVEDLLSVGSVNLTAGTIRVAAPVLQDEAVRLQDLQNVAGSPAPQPINWLTDVDTATFAPTVGAALAWNGTQWVPASVTGSVVAGDVGAVPTAGTQDRLWANIVSLVGTATPGAVSPLAPSYARDGVTGTWFKVAPQVLADLADVDTTGVAVGQTIVWDGAAWIPGTAGGGGSSTLDGLTDVTVPAPVDGDILVWSSVASQWVNSPPAAGATLPTAGAGLVGGAASYDVAADPLLPGIVVTPDAVGFDPAIAGVSLDTHTHSMDDLSDADTTTTAPGTGNVLLWNGTNWVPGAVAPIVAPTGEGVWRYQGTVVGADPGAGNATMSGTGSGTRTFAVSRFTVPGDERNLGVMRAGDNLTITDAPGGAVTQFARFALTTDVTDNGAWFSFDAVLSDGGFTPTPAPGTPVRIMGTFLGGQPVVPATRQVTAGAGLTGGGALSADVTLDAVAGTGIVVAADSISLDEAYTDTLYQPAGVAVPQALDDLTDVAGAAGATVGQALVSDGAGQWAPGTVSAGGTTYIAGAGLTETPAGTFNVGQGTGIVVGPDTVAVDQAVLDGRYSQLSHAHALDDLTDTDTSTVPPAASDVLMFDGLGQWRPGALPAAVSEVGVGTAAPTFTADGIWADTTGLTGVAAPDATAPVAPTYAYDALTGLWSRGVAQSDLDAAKAQADTDYVNVAGDTMTGLLQLSGAPTIGLHAARYADAIPRFPDTATRDAFYAALAGGPQAGMKCFVAPSYQMFDGTAWRPSGSTGGGLRGKGTGGGLSLTDGVTQWFSFTPKMPAPGDDFEWVAGGVKIPWSGNYEFVGQWGVNTTTANSLGYVYITSTLEFIHHSAYFGNLSTGGSTRATVSGVLACVEGEVVGMRGTITGTSSTSRDLLLQVHGPL